MGRKIKFLLPASVLVFCLIVFSGFAATGFTPSTNSMNVNWVNASGLSNACYSNYIDITNTAAINITVDNSTGISGIPFAVYNSTKYSNMIYDTGLFQTSFIFDTTGKSGGTYSGSFDIYQDGDTQNNDTINVIVYVPRELSELVTTPDTIYENIEKNVTRTTTFNINNLEDYGLTISGVSDSLSLNENGYMNFTHNLTAETIPANTNITYQADVIIDTTKANVTGTYSGWIKLNTTNDCSGYQTYTIPFSVELKNTINTTVLDAYNVSTGDVGTPGKDMTIEVVPKFWNGAMVLNLNETNFTITLTHVNHSLLPDANDTAILTPNSFTEGASKYTLTALVPSNLYGGNYTVSVSATDGTLSGTDTFDNTFALEGATLVMTVDDCGGSSMTTIGAKKTCTYTVKNYGYSSASSVNITYSVDSSCVTPAPSSSQLGSIGSGASNTSQVNATAAAEGNCVLTGTGSASSDSKWGAFSLGRYFTVTLTTDDPTTNTNENTASSSSSETTSVTAKVSKMSVSATTPISIEQGKTKDETITVTNTGGYNLKDVSVSVAGIDSSWYSVTGKQDILFLKTKTYDLNLDIPENAEPISYTLTITANGKDVNNKDVSASSSTTLKILPSEETQAAILTNLTEYEDWYGNVMRMFNSTKLAEENATEVESTLNQVTGLLTKASSHASLGEYFEAYEALREVRKLLTQAESDMGVQEGSFDLVMFERFRVFSAVLGAVVLFVIIYFAHRSGKIDLSKIKKPKFGSKRSFGGRSGRSLKLKQKTAGMKLKAQEFKKKFKKKKKNIKKGNFKVNLRGYGE